MLDHGKEETNTTSKLRTNIVIGLFVIAYTSKYLLMAEQNVVHVSESLTSSTKVPFDYPFFQMLSTYMGEFIFTIGYWIWMKWFA